MIRIAIIGGGAAGLMAAVCAGEGGAVTVFEKMPRCGQKIRITGKGRCNVTTTASVAEMQDKIPRGAKFLRSALYAFPPESTVRFFEEAGVPLKIERGGRIFPVSNKADDIAEALICAAEKSGAEILFESVLSVEARDGGFQVYTHKGGRFFDRVILATGGASYPRTGSTGDGYRFARALGHTVTAIQPALIPLTVRESLCQKAQGLSLKNAAITVKDGEKTVYAAFGELLFTHFGLSGPIILSASSHLDFEKNKTYSLFLDLKPALDRETLDKRILRDFSESINKDLVNAVSGLLPQKIILPLLTAAGLDPRKKVNEITRAERARLIDALKALPLTVTGTRPLSEAIVTRGGVNTGEVDPRRMESRRIPGLFFAGEVLDLDAETGGFNLQIAFATGALAGKSAAKQE